MIVRIKLKSKNGDIFTMLFGNSYKKWNVQFREYCLNFKPVEILDVKTSRSEWKSWGGLKWCNELSFQYELNREGCQSIDTDNPYPRIYSNMIFNSNRIAENFAKSIVRFFLQ
jgi:hypothetical protein